jgi:hypothetical protein
MFNDHIDEKIEIKQMYDLVSSKLNAQTKVSSKP